MFLQNVSIILQIKTEPTLDRRVKIWYLLRKDDVSPFPCFKDRHPTQVFSIDPHNREQGPGYADFCIMAKQSKITWSKMDFKDFINHFKGMTRKEIADDVLQSIKDFEDLNTDSNSFGSEQVKKAVCTSKERRAEASRENGKLGGRPKGSRNKQKTEPETDTQKRIEDALQTMAESCRDQNTAKSISNHSAPPKTTKRPFQKKVYTLPKRQTPLPKSADDVQDIVFKCNLDGDDAYQWWQMTMVERHGHDRWGRPIMNWPGALIRFCEAMAAKRVADA